MSYTVGTSSSNAAIRSEVLEGLSHKALGPDEEAAGRLVDFIPPLRVLFLNGTKMDDSCSVAIAGCKALRSLHLENSRITLDGLQLILDSCPDLHTLNLSGCRGIPVHKRRNAFGESYSDPTG